MDRLRRTLSFRSRKKKRRQQTESAQPHQWQEDERKVREGTCSFQVKYLGCVEVLESRGMQICEEAHKVLRHKAKKRHRISFRKKTKNKDKVLQAILYISGDSLRVIEDKAGITQDDGQGLIVDQTIEKVSFCAPDRDHPKGFSYICRDGTTRRWMCHGFLALKESGERLSHAVGCAFAVCLEKKQKREKEAVSVSYNDDKTSFARLGSFRQATLTERLADPQSTKIAEPIVSASGSPATTRANVEIAQVERPHASANLLLRQGSFREFNRLNREEQMDSLWQQVIEARRQTSPFKRNLSLRLNELPSNLNRQHNDFDKPLPGNNVPIIEGDELSPDATDSAPQSASLASALTESQPKPEVKETWDPIAEMCQQLTQGITGLTKDEQKPPTQNNNVAARSYSSPATTSKVTPPTAKQADPIKQTNPWAAPLVQENDFWLPPASSSAANSQSAVTISATASAPVAGSVSSTTTTPQHIRPRPTATLQQTNPYPGSISASPQQANPANTLSNGSDPFIQPTFTLSANQQAQHTFVPPPAKPATNGTGAIGIVAPPSNTPQNPFDTAWALRSTSNNPFLTNTTTTTSTATTQHQQFNKEFEITM